MKTHLKHIIFFTAVLLPSLFCRADIPDTVNLSTVEIHGKHPAQSMMEKQFDSLSLAGFHAADLGQLLQYGSHINIKSNGPGGISTASFRGTSANHTLVLWNDIPINTPNLGSVDFSTIPLHFADQIGLAWGSQASSSWSGGLGGVVMMNNRPAFDRKWNLDVTQNLSGFSQSGTFATIGYSNKIISVRSRFFRKSAKNDFEYFNNGVLPSVMMKQSNADFTDFGFMQEVYIANGKNGVIGFHSWHQWNDHNLPPIMTNISRGGDPKEFQHDKFHRSILSYKHFWKNGKIDLKTSWFIEDQHYFLQTTSSENPDEIVTLINSKNHSEGFRSMISSEQQLKPGWVVFGKLLSDFERVETTNYHSTQSRQKLSLQIGSRYKTGDWLTTSFNLRKEWVNNKFSDVNPAIEFIVKPIRSIPITIGSGYSTNLRYPGLNDLYWFPGGNSMLRPEKSKGMDLSIHWMPKTGNFIHHIGFNVFYADISDWIQWRPTSYRFWTPVNIARVIAQGVETNYKMTGEWYIFDIQLATHYTYTLTTDESPVAKIENTSGKQLIYVPKHQANVLLHISLYDNYLRYSTAYVGKRNASMNGDEVLVNHLRAYMTHNVTVGRKFIWLKGDFMTEVFVNNLFDKQYQAVLWRPMPGRHFGISIRYKIN